MTTNLARAQRNYREDPTEGETEVKLTRLDWVRAVEETWVMFHCWKDSQEGEGDVMRKVAKDYQDRKYGTQEDSAMKKLKVDAKKQVGEKRLRENDLLLREAVMNGYEAQRSRQDTNSEMVVYGETPRYIQASVVPPRNRMTFSQLGAAHRQKVENVLSSPPPSMRGKYVTVGDREIFTDTNRNLQVANDPGYYRRFVTQARCRECGLVGHEAWECREEYEYDGMHCIPPLLLYPQYVSQSAQVLNAERAGGPRRER